MRAWRRERRAACKPGAVGQGVEHKGAVRAWRRGRRAACKPGAVGQGVEHSVRLCVDVRIFVAPSKMVNCTQRGLHTASLALSEACVSCALVSYMLAHATPPPHTPLPCSPAVVAAAIWGAQAGAFLCPVPRAPVAAGAHVRAGEAARGLGKGVEWGRGWSGEGGVRTRLPACWRQGWSEEGGGFSKVPWLYTARMRVSRACMVAGHAW
eukprot:365343-Chlamydomonas_euryale.AAC.3